MSTRPTPIDDRLWDYLCRVSLREHPLMAKLREETARMAAAECQISPEQAQFMALLVRLLGARRALEIGTFTGYSSLAVALALPQDGRLVCCDSSEEWTAVARRYWKSAGVAHKVELRLGAAAQTLERMTANGEKASYDFAFVDADKTGYRHYYERCLELLRPGGLAVFDNMLWEGRVADSRCRDEDTKAIRDLNAFAACDPRVASSLLQVGDGVLLALKLPQAARGRGEARRRRPVSAHSSAEARGAPFQQGRRQGEGPAGLQRTLREAGSPPTARSSSASAPP